MSKIQRRRKRSPYEMSLGKLLQELESFQVELESQNKALIDAARIIEESNERYIDLYDFAPVGYLSLDRMGVIREMNLTAADLMGAPRPNLLNRSFCGRLASGDHVSFRRHILECREGVKTTSAVMNLAVPGHDSIPIQLLSVAVRNHKTGRLMYRTAISDLTDQKRVESENQHLTEQVQAAHQELYDFFMQAPTPMAIVNGPQHTFTLANQPYVLAAGMEVVGKTVREVFSNSAQAVLLEKLDAVFATGQPFLGKEIVLPKDELSSSSRQRYVDVSFTAFRSTDGSIRGVLISGQDVTDQVLARHKLEADAQRELDYQAELRKQKIEAERANQTKSAFLANMSHEIRTPLAAILGFTELINRSSSKEERNELGEVINRNGKVLTRLIDDILDLSKVEAGRLQLEKIDFDLRALVYDVVELFQESALKNETELLVSVDPQLPPLVNSDPTRIRQILMNLVGNAVKFTTGGQVSVRVQGITRSKRISEIKFVVRDNGIGMTKEQAARLFEPFSQADNSTTRKFGGSGLGLVLSRRLARALGGDVHILRCAPGLGCIFVARMSAQPATREVLGKPKPPVAPKEIGASSISKKYRILLVEDSPDNQMLVSMLLRKAGMTVDIANNGAEGIAMAESNNYDVILMDMQMPVVDGYEAVERLRDDGYGKPIVALTAHAMIEDRNRILSLGCDAHLTKPLDSKLLIETIDKLGYPH